jgi:hypothetical protein
MAARFQKLSRDIGKASSSLQLFLIVYRFLDDGQFWGGAFGRQHELYDKTAQTLVAAWHDDVIRTVLTTPPSQMVVYFQAIASASKKRPDADLALDLLKGLRAIDAALAGAHLFGPDAVGKLAPFQALRNRLRASTPYEVWKEWGIFPKPRPALDLRGQYLDDYLNYLSVVHIKGAQTSIAIKYQANDLARDGVDELECVGAIPVVLAANHVKWALLEPQKYSVALNPDELDNIIKLVMGGMDWLLARKPQIVMLPELVNHPELLKAIKLYLSGRTSRGEYTPSLVMCGSKMTKVGSTIRNRAYVLAGDGVDLWTQDKMHAYKFSKEEQRDAGYPLKEAVPVDRTEDIGIHPREITLYDMGSAWRCAVLICEDFQQDESVKAMQGWDVSLLLVPVMNGPFDRSSWAFDRAVQLAKRPGMTTAIVNSATLMAPLPASVSVDAVASRLARIVGCPRVNVAWEALVPPGFQQPSAIFARLSPYTPPV